MHRSVLLTCASTTLAMVSADGLAAAVTVEGVAMTGIEGLLGPGVESGTTFLDLSPPSVDAVGNLVFFAHVEGPGVPFGAERGVWQYQTSGPFNVVAVREGALSPFNGAPISFLLNNPVGGAHNVAAQTFDEALVNEFGIVDTLAHTSMAAPDVGAGVTFGDLDFVRLDSNENYAFICFLHGAVTATNAPAVYSGGLGTLSLVARGEDVAPDTPGDMFSGFSDLTMSPDGGIGLLANLTSGGAGIWAGAPGSLSKVVEIGDSVPGLGTLVFLNSYSIADSSGTTVFEGFTNGPSISNEGVWTGTPGALQLVYAENEQVDGLPVGVLYGAQNVEAPPPLINASGQIAAVTRLKGTGVDSTNWTAIVAGTPGSMSAIVRTGDVAPDSGGRTFQNITGYAMGDSGHVAFIAQITDGVTTDIGMYAWHASTGLMLVARNGDIVNFGAGGDQTIESISFTQSSGNGKPSGLGHDGTLGFLINFNGADRGVVRAALPGGTDPADFNGDGAVDGADLATLLASWGACPAPCPPDLDGDGDVDGADLAILLAAWGP